MTQRELAKRAEITQPHLAEIESGKRDPRWSTLKRIFAALSCELYIDPRPKKSMKEILRGRARKLALKRLKQSMGSMALEGQASDREIFLKLLEKRTDEILADRSQRLWQDKND
jgi:transcriptional regulator with XRE-family HTH domain